MPRDYFTRYWLAGAIVLTVVTALVFPAPGLVLSDSCVIDIGVVLIMFLGALKITPDRFKKAIARVDLLFLSGITVFAVAPAASLGLAWVLGLDEGTDRLAVLICTAQATTLASAIVLTEVAGGDVALAMVITVVNNVATVILTPLIFKVAADAQVDVDHLAMAGEMALKILTPVLAAQLVRRRLEKFVSRNKRRMSVTSQLIILIYVYTGVAAASARLEGAGPVLARVAVLVIALHAAMLIFSAIVSRITTRSPEMRVAFVLCSSQKTLPAAILIWKSYFSSLPIGPLVAVAYHMLQLVVDSMLAPGFLRLPLVRNRARHMRAGYKKGKDNG